MPWFLTATISLLPILLAYILARSRSRKRSGLPLPPGPKGWPLVGNLFTSLQGHEWHAYDRWCSEYGTDILYLNMAVTPLVVLNTYEGAFELLDNRSAKYSGRPRMTMVNELMGWEFNFTWMDYGDRWRQLRKLFHHQFQPSVVHQFQPQQLKYARALALKLRDTADVMADIRQMAGEIIISVSYGLDVLPKNDPYVGAAEIAVRALLDASVPGAFLVDSIPAMKYIPPWFPGAAFRRQAREWRILVDRMLSLPFEAMLKSMESGTIKPSFSLEAMRLMQSDSVEGSVYTEDNIKAVAATVYQTGSDTTLSAISFCIISLLDNPHLVKILQDELDSITDCSRLPDFNDENLTPYLMAVIKETLRYWSIAPLALNRLALTEDEFNGYRIPGFSMIVPNVWKMLHNPEVFPDPFSFKPARFLGVNPLRDSHFDSIWGFGRRICPGRYMAYQSVWITMATVLSIYDIKKALDPNGKPIEPSREVVSSILIYTSKAIPVFVYCPHSGFDIVFGVGGCRCRRPLGMFRPSSTEQPKRSL